MKTAKLKVERDIKQTKELFKEHARRGIGYGLADGRNVYCRELFYHALKKFDDGIDYPIFSICLEALLNNSTFSIPHYYYINKSQALWGGYKYILEKLGIIRSYRADASFPFFYKQIRNTFHELASNFRQIGDKLRTLEKETGADPTYLQQYEGMNYDDIKSGKQLISDRDIEKLEKFFGEKVVPRWKHVETFGQLLYTISEKILEGWEEKEKIKQFVEEKNISLSSHFKAKILAPKDLLENSTLPCDQVVLALIEPLSETEINEKLGYASIASRNILSVLGSYGIVEKIGRKYVLSSLQPFEIALQKLSRRVERYRKYIAAMQLSASGELCSKISSFLDIPIGTINHWITRYYKPHAISNYTAELLLKRGIISENDLKVFKEYELIH